jgi:tripartite-type tricarboxylate transporter receptor subunit TctC
MSSEHGGRANRVRGRAGLTRRGIGLLAGVAVLSPWCGVMRASPAFAYPEGPVRLVIPLPPGGIADIVARVLQPHLESAFGKAFVIENRPGASGIVGANAVVNSTPDGQTLLFVTTTYSINAALRPSVQQIRKLEAVGIAAEGSQLFLLNPKVPASTLKEFVALAKAAPGKYFYASTGIASHSHLLFELFSQQAGIKMKHVPYPGGPPAVLATVNGEAHITLISPAASLPHIREGALRAIATGGDVREKELPDVPTAAEAGFPDFHARQWIGLLAPPGTPKPVVESLNRELQRILQRDDVTAVLARQGLTTSRASPAEFQKMINDEVQLWADVADRAGIKVGE